MDILAQDMAHFKTLKSTKVPKIIRAVVLILLVAITLVVLFLTFAPWVQTSAGAGQVTALRPSDREQSINAVVDGRIEEWFVQDGSAVKKGDPIVRISDIDPQLIERLQQERVQLQIQLSAARNNLALSQLELNRSQELFREGLGARRAFEQAQIMVQQARTSVAEVNASINRLDVNLSRQSAQTVFAPRDGFIQTITGGDSATVVSTGDVLATFVPEIGERVIEIFVDGQDVALIQPGAEARIQFEGWPIIQFSGWPSTAVGTFHGSVMSVDPSAQVNGMFRVLISEDKAGPYPWPDERFVRYGAAVRSWILLETVPVGYELWRQLNNFPPQLPNSRPATMGQGSTT